MAVCPTCGFGEPDPEPVIIEDGSAQADAAESLSDASVRVAEIEADRDVTIARLGARQIDAEVAAELAAMQARIDVLEAASIPAEPAPVPVPVPIPEPEPEPPAAPPETEPKAERKPPAKRGFFS